MRVTLSAGEERTEGGNRREVQEGEWGDTGETDRQNERKEREGGDRRENDRETEEERKRERLRLILLWVSFGICVYILCVWLLLSGVSLSN